MRYAVAIVLVILVGWSASAGVFSADEELKSGPQPGEMIHECPEGSFAVDLEHCCADRGR